MQSIELMQLLSLLITIVFLLFAFVVAFGAPYLPTLGKQVEEALDLIDLKPNQKLLELGCGDGKVVVAAAERGMQVIGYEINPILAFICWARTRKYRGKVKIVWGDSWKQDFPETDGIFVFLLDKYMEKLDKKIVHSKQKNKIKLVSFAFKIPEKKFVKEKSGLYLYEYNN